MLVSKMIKASKFYQNDTKISKKNGKEKTIPTIQ